MQYEEELFILKATYNKVVEALAAFCEGTILVRDDALNIYYTVMLENVRLTLDHNGFEQLKADLPELYESLIGNIDDFAVSWKCGLKQEAYDFLAKIEKACILSKTNGNKLPYEVIENFKTGKKIIEEHKKKKKMIWDKMIGEEKSNKKVLIFEADLTDKFAIWKKENKEKIWNMKKRSDGEFSVSGKHMLNLLKNMGECLVSREAKNNIIKTIAKKLNIPMSEIEKIFFDKNGAWGINKGLIEVIGDNMKKDI